MISFISVSKAQQKIAMSVRERRLLLELTQEGLSERSGVPLPTLRKFEQKGVVSLEALLKLLLVVGGIEDVVSALKLKRPTFSSIDEVLDNSNIMIRKRGRKK